MTAIWVNDLSFNYAGLQVLFDHISLTLDTDWKLALIGPNGAGKTTFLKILAGQLEFRGSVQSPVPLVYFPPVLPDLRITASELLASLRPGAPLWRLQREVDLLGLAESALYRPFSHLSRGETAKILLAFLFLDDCFPLIDEPAAGLDAAGRRVVTSYLAAKKGFILVTHDRYLLNLADHVLALNPEGLSLERGDYNSWAANRELKIESDLARQKKLANEIQKLNEAAQRSSDWARRAEGAKFGQGPVDRGFLGHKAQKINKRAKSLAQRRQKAVEAKSFVPVYEKPAPLTLTPLPFHNRRLAEGRNLRVGYGEAAILENLNFQVENGVRLVLTGPNGSGKSSLLKLFLGQARVLGGEFYRHPELKISYVPQNLTFPHKTFSEMASALNLPESRFKAVLNYLGLEKRHFDTELTNLSLGQKKKAYLAASVLESANLYLWDEPLDHLDLDSRLQIERLLLQAQPTIIVVEHDQVFADRVGTARLDLSAFQIKDFAS